MKQRKITSTRLNESYTEIQHPSGLAMMLYPMEGFTSTYALFGTQYGSVDNHFKTQTDDDFTTVPAGIAHFLEHKLFESEDGDAFTRYARTGASANAYTSFDRTAYLFSCTENFEESLEILLDFVTHPFFSEESVQKEQGIIGQEIGMYDDDPNWQVFFGLLGALYHENPVREDIAGTVDSIAKIDAELLYHCYNTFYNLNNMVLCIAGNFDVDVVLRMADKILGVSEPVEITRGGYREPSTIVQRKVEKNLPVAQPLFQIGFKGVPDASEAQGIYHLVQDELLLDIIAGESSRLYRELYDNGLINQTFSGEAMANRDYSITMFGGESRDPEKVHQRIVEEVQRLGQEGIDPEMYRRCKKALYGRYIGMFGRPDTAAGMMLSAHMAGIEAYELLDAIANIDLDLLQERLILSFNSDKCALSVVRP